MITGTTTNNYDGTATSTTTWQYNYPTTVICSYKGKCSSEGYKCGTCKRNEYKDYYIQDGGFTWTTGTLPCTVTYDNSVITADKICCGSVSTNKIVSGTVELDGKIIGKVSDMKVSVLR